MLSGRVTLAPVPLDLAAAEHEVELDLEPVWLNCDPTRLQQVIGNLVENAAKYTQAGGRIRVTVRAQADMGELAVADNGKGIDADLLPRIRDVFVQGQVLGRAKGGLGIGLAVVKSLVEQQHRTVAVASGGPRQGSTFTVRLPLAGAGPARAVRRGQRRPARHDVRAAAVARLHGDDGRAALALAERQRPDVAFVDIDLPDISGYEVARRLARRGGIRLVAVTGYGHPEDVRRALAAGFDVHLKKPVRPDELERALGAADQVR